MLGIDLNGKRAFIAGVADDRGYGWAIAKALAAAGAKICVGTWPPTLGIFQKSLDRNKLDVQLADGSSMVIEKTYPLDAVFDLPADVPADIREDKRYKELAGYTISEVAEQIKADFGGIDIVIHSLANGPEVKNALLETSRQGYLAALSASAFSLVSMVQRFGPMMPKGGAVASLSYLAAVRTVPGYGGGMSSAKAALESDTRTLAYEAGRKWGVRINTVSAGPLASRAAKAIGTIEKTVDYYADNSPLGECNSAQDVGNTVAFLVSPLAAAITGATIYVDKGYNTMGLSPAALTAE